MITLLLRRFFLGLILLFLALPNLLATHIIGGEMNYACLGNNQYEISLTVYRDCFLGEALMDDTAYVAVYDQIGTLVTTIPMLLGQVDTVFQLEDCLLAPENICVETTVYRDIIELAPISGGYHISYQRCCRNATILNIKDPLNTGATYDIILTDAAMAACNASPQIKAWPPTFICVNRPLNFNHSASDREGDSLVYKLCTPFEGGISLINPRPRPAFAPPYDTIVWVAPTYSLENLLGGIPLKIDPKTGILTGTPATIGQFVVGVCVEEYRNGQLLSETRRDFQYNVIPCQDITADFSVPEKQCDNLVVSVENKSLGGNNYLWKFLKQDSLIGSSTEFAPSFTFPTTGDYAIRLILEPNTACIDSIEKNISLITNTLVIDFSNELIGCEDSLFLQLNDRSTSEQEQIISRLWTLTGPITQFSSTEIAPRFNIKQSQIFDVSLQIFTESGCSALLQKDIEAIVIPGASVLNPPDTITACAQVPVELNPNADPNLQYTWESAAGLNDPTIANPEATINTSTQYTVTVNDVSKRCFFERSVFVEVKQVLPDFDWNAKNCTSNGIELILEDKSTIDNGLITAWNWTLSNGDTSTEQNPSFLIKELDTLIVTLSIVVDENLDCIYSKEQVIVYQQPIFPDFPSTLFACYQSDLALNENPDTNFTYEWFPRNLINHTTSPNPIVNLTDTSEISVTLTDDMGCTLSHQILVTIPSPIEINASTDVTLCKAGLSTEIYAYSTQATQQFWLNELGDTLGFEAELPIKIEQTSQFTSVIQDTFGCLQQQEITVQIAPILLEYEDRYTLCLGDTLALVLESVQAMQEITYNWENNASIIGEGNTNTLLVHPESTTSYEFTASNQSGCETKDTLIVEVLDKPVVTISAATTTIINGTSVELQATENPNFTYVWSPNNTLSNLSIYNPIASPIENTSYELLVTDENGCTNTTTIQLEVQTAICNTPYIFVPSAFTPNNDGENDVLFVRGDMIEQLEFIIYDRWGRKIFESTNQNIGWTGNYKGKKLPSGVFGYYLYARCLGGEDYYKQGNVTLIR